jgi:hypothetical protein
MTKFPSHAGQIDSVRGKLEFDESQTYKSTNLRTFPDVGISALCTLCMSL